MYVNLVLSQLGGIHTMDARKLRTERWARGNHLNTFPESQKLKTLWPLFDPAGSVRFALRKGIAQRALHLLGELFKVDGYLSDGNLTAARKSLAMLVGENVGETVDAQSGGRLMDEALATIGSADKNRLACIAKKWATSLDDPESWSVAGEAAVATLYKEAERNQLSIKVKQEGAIVVGNTHFVHVNLDIFLSEGYRDLERYVEVVAVDQQIEWEQTGFVVVYTVDNIEVNVSVDANRVLPSARLEQALSGC